LFPYEIHLTGIRLLYAAGNESDFRLSLCWVQWNIFSAKTLRFKIVPDTYCKFLFSLSEVALFGKRLIRWETASHVIQTTVRSAFRWLSIPYDVIMKLQKIRRRHRCTVCHTTVGWHNSQRQIYISCLRWVFYWQGCRYPYPSMIRKQRRSHCLWSCIWRLKTTWLYDTMLVQYLVTSSKTLWLLQALSHFRIPKRDA